MADDPKKDAEIEARFWAALRRDMTVMLGLGTEIDQRPMTAQLASDEDKGPVYFFGHTDSDLHRALGGSFKEAQFSFASKGHDVWATVAGGLRADNDRATIDKLWNAHVAAWYEGGRDDPKLVLYRFDVDHAKIWKDASSLFAGFLSILGRDPKKDYQDSVAEVGSR